MRSSQQPDDVDITYRAAVGGGAWGWALTPRGLMSWEVLELRVRPGALSFSSPHQPALAVICCISVSLCVSHYLRASVFLGSPRLLPPLSLCVCLCLSPSVSPCFLSSLTLSRWPLSPVGAPAALVPSQPVSIRAPCRCQPARAVSVCLVPSGVPTLPTAPGRQEALNKYFLNE